ncbi:MULTISPECIES: ABC transporter ATP-binding protein [Shouchella]|uniref:Oligopeptide transport ATP-binding protein OppD n=3 Tax=Bacillaceae TaxID=186817 RepID=A0A060M6C6_9BACI|nr:MULTISPECIES: ABC transporter ATP-binding protein [Bacillaceae]AIC95629.1 Oligopeptide transport ATP-binding protein OppD [Shouchella lehensis G1]KQL55746.1 dipeptide/oligopeptide/nickel ABC transporter ATP-binding protein [Alkalicoccobacillus plakortidis]MBG9783672.1 peptide ABC transporter ATPase [Shouchella lehensis]TES51380.1 ABC transporter ATP-binding protein [Shouchella lehensis]
MSDNTLLQIQNLKTSFRINNEYYAAVDDVTLTVNKNEILGIVGESGSGKSALGFSILGLHPKDKSKIEGEINYKGEDIAKVSEARLQKLRGGELGMIFQDPMSALNPLMIIGKQLEESLILHTNLSKTERKNRVLELLQQVGISRPDVVYSQYPHELSGGMRQRVVIGIAISCNPAFLIADEPTTALDVTIQAQILGLISKLKNELNSGVILITHDLGVVAEMADKVAVMYAGQIVELAPVEELFANPKHPYTRSLLQSNPTNNTAKTKLHVIQGVVPSLVNLPRTGCRFAERIPWIGDAAHEENPQLHEISPNHYVRCSCYKTFEFAPKEEVADGISAN